VQEVIRVGRLGDVEQGVHQINPGEAEDRNEQ
jgi:hypothetical protein